MSDLVTLLCRDGSPIPLYQQSMPMKEHAGIFSHQEEHDREARRTMPVARLMGRNGDVVPPLWDARLLNCKRGIAVLTGYEVANPLSRQQTTQMWKVRLAGWPGPGMDPE